MSKTYDVIIIGGGIMGCSTAFQLSKRGLKVGLLEKKTIGEGPTGRSSAIIRQHYSNELTARMALHSLRVFQDFEEQVGGECGFTKVGCMTMVAAQDQTGLEANMDLQRRVGIHTELLSPEALRDVMPEMQTTDLVAAAFEPESGYTDPYLTVNAYAQAARRHGAQIFQDTEVVRVRFSGDKVVGVDTTEEQFEAPLVLNCSGAWGAQVARMADVQVPINSCRVQVSFFRRPSGHEAPHPVVLDFAHGVYFRPETGNLTVAGLIDSKEANAIVDPDNFREGVDNDFVLDSGERMVARYPAMEHCTNTGGYASIYAISPDWHPIIDELPKGSGFFICSGFSGHGFKLGPAVGQMFAELVTGVSGPLFDPSLFRFSRFDEKDPVRGQYEYGIAG